MAKRVGAVVVQRILHVPQNMKGNGLKRFLKTKQYNQEKQVVEISLTNKQEKEFGATPSINTMAKAKATTADKAVATTKKATAKKATSKKAAGKKAAGKKAAGKKASSKKAAGTMRRLDKGEKGGKIAKIIAMHREGKTNQEIIKKGYSPNTVAINVSLYKRGLLKIKY